MPPYGTGERTLSVVDRWEGGVGWQVHPGETLARTGHALRTDDGLWLVDPLDAPGLDDLLSEFGPVAGVVVCSSWHARDAGTIADRHGLPVSVPAWIERVPERVETGVEFFSGPLGGYELRATTPLPTWQEAVLWRERDGTLYVPESMGTGPVFPVGDERLGVSPYRRLLPPRDVLGDLEPERVLVGHGEGIEDNATGELTHALANARRRAPRALATNALTLCRTLWASRRR
jgi:hypothetical protein